MVLFSVIDDIFRNRQTSGVTKALWILLLIVLPIITVIVYLIVDGGAMAERSAARSLEAQAQQDSYIKNVAGTNSPADQVAKAKALLDSGAQGSGHSARQPGGHNRLTCMYVAAGRLSFVSAAS